MIEAICIDDSGKPNDVPNNKWLEEGKIYNIIYVTTVLPQEELGVSLAEIDLDESCYPYEYFLFSRFAIHREDVEEFEKLMIDCIDANISVKELMQEINLTGLT